MQIRFMPGLAHYNGYSLRTNSSPDTIPAPGDNYSAITVERTRNAPRFRNYHLFGEQVSAEIVDASQNAKAVVTRTVEKGRQWFLTMNPAFRHREATIPIDLLI